jgi:hypothetical protein
MVAYNYPYSSPSSTEVSDSLGTALADPNTVFAKTGGKKKRSTPDMLAERLTPMDFGAIGDAASHTLASLGYATLAAAQVDYPAATALTDEADWCALKYLFETSGVRQGQGNGKYVINNSDLSHTIRWQAGLNFTWGPNSQVIFNTFGYPVFAATEQSDIVVEGLNLLATGTMSAAFNNALVFTKGAYNSIVGNVDQNVGDRNFHGCVVLSGCDRFKGRRWTIRHQSPGIAKPANHNGIYLHVHLNGGPNVGVEFSDMQLDDIAFGILLEGTQYLKMHNIVSKRRNQIFADLWAAGHIVYFTYVNGNTHLHPDVMGVYDGGGMVMTDSYPITVDTSADTITAIATAQPMTSTMVNGQGVIFQEDLPPAPLIRGKQYFVINYTTGVGNTAPYTFQVANTNGGAAIDLTAAPGANCRVSVTQPLFTLNCRYMQQGSVRRVKSLCPYGLISIHTQMGTTIEDLSIDCQIFSGVLSAVTATGGTFDAGVNDHEGYTQGKRIRILGGPANGSEYEITAQNIARVFTVTPPWSVLPVVGDPYEVGTRYAGSSPPMHSPGTGHFSLDHVRVNRAQIMGEFASWSAFLQDADLISNIPQSKDLRYRDIDIEMDISRNTAAGIMIVRCQQLSLTATVRLTGTWLAGEKGLITPLAGVTGWADITLEDPALYSRIVGAANNDFVIKLRSKTGKPAAYLGLWANEASTPTMRIQAEPVVQKFIAPGGSTSGAGTITLTNFGNLKDRAGYYISALIHDTNYTQVCEVDWYVVYGSTGSPSIIKLNTRQYVGVAITTMDITMASGALSGTITTSATVAVVLSWTSEVKHPVP